MKFITFQIFLSSELFKIEDLPSPEIALPAILFLIILCIFLLNLVQKEKSAEQITNKDPRSHEAFMENDVYSRMYGSSHTRNYEEEDEVESIPILSRNSINNRKKNTFNSLEGERYSSAVLVQKEGSNPGNKYFLDKDEITIGSGDDNDIVLWDASVSKNHSKIKKIDEKYVLFDRVSAKGILLNGKKLLRPKVLYDFDEIRLGKTIFVFRGK